MSMDPARSLISSPSATVTSSSPPASRTAVDSQIISSSRRNRNESNTMDPTISIASTSATVAVPPPINPFHRAISPPTPAPSPQPEIRNYLESQHASTSITPSPLNDSSIPPFKQLTQQFSLMHPKDREAFLTSLVDVCTARELAYLSSIISPRLKVNFLSALPIEVSLQIISFMDLKSLASASGVSRFWRSLVNDEHTWKVMCDKYKFRQYPVQPGTSQQQADLETPDRSLQSIDGLSSSGSDAHSTHLPNRSSALDSSFYSNQVLSNLYETYIARGLDAATALTELKALHTLFLTKRSREMNVEERRRQFQALQSHGAFSHLIQDRTALERVGGLSMSDEDKQFYQALEEFVQEKRDSNVNTEDDANNAGWLSTGPPSSRTMGSLPQTPTVPSGSGPSICILSSVPSLSMGRSIVSPTSRFGSMTTGLLNSFWDRSGNTSENGHAPSAGDHGHSTEGHTDLDIDMTGDEREGILEDIPRSMYPPSLGRNRSAGQALRVMPIRGASQSERSVNAPSLNLGAGNSPNTGLNTTAKRHASSGYERANVNDPYRQSASRRSKPFSYKTHFKLAYLTESNWLRGGRLLTQHVSSDEASGEGPVVTSLSIDDEWIVVGMANAKIHVFDAKTGLFVKTLVGHSSGVWCLSLISASASSSRSGKGKETMADAMDEDAASGTMTSLGAYPYDNDRPLYTPTPDLNLIHHDPRPTATTFSPEVSFADINQADRRSSSTPLLTKMPKIGERLSYPLDDISHHEQSEDTPSEQSQSSRQSSRGAGLGSNFGSPCGSVQGYGNRNALVVSGGCDRDVRVWDLSTGECKFVLNGHRSTVRCLRVLEGRPIAISGARDGTLRVWNVETGAHIHTLAGHQHSVRCLDVAGNMVASASYDCSCRVWNVDTGKCIHVLRGHYHQIYAVAFDGVRIATGSLDSTVRVWSAETGECLALFQGHTSLVGQLQLTDSTLITGGSDGRVIVFSLQTCKVLYQLMAHDNSVTCLQFDDRFIVTGGNDGKVKLWNFKTGEFVRILCEQSDQVWKVSFRDDKCVVLCKRKDKTAMDVISFRPIEETI